MQAGTRLGPYEIVELIGAGGMGQVYRARDTRLDRTVAIKILPQEVSSSLEHKQRFEREARAISSLQHPHICVLHDVGEAAVPETIEKISYLVMEYLDGESLAQRLNKGPLSTEEVLKIGTEIAGALDKAHRQGLIHRDLKPGNVMLTKSGAKLLDFGLAKPSALAAVAAPGNASLATLTSAAQPVTQRGMISGTFQYMAPEQLQGKEADARSDIFALGALLYEGATGKPAFTGQSQISVMSAILEREPEPISVTNAASPPALDFVLRTCMAKDPDQRFQTAHDVGLQLKWIAGHTAPAVALPGLRGRKRIPSWIGWAVAAVAVLAALGLWWTNANTPKPVVRFVVPFPPKHSLPGDIGAVTISDDGRKIAYAASENGNIQIFVQSLDSFAPVVIPNSDGATFPFFSPDSRWIVFYTRGQLWKATSDGSMSPTPLASLPTFYGGSWAADGTLILSSNPPLLTASPDGGTPKPLPIKEKLDSGSPIRLPGGDWILFTEDRGTQLDILAARISTGELKTVVPNAMEPIYAGGRLIYYSSGSIWATPFDAKSVRVTGPPEVLAKDVAGARWFGHFGASQNGTLIYVKGTNLTASRDVVWVDRKGVAQKVDAAALDYVDPSVDPDGKHFVVCIRTATEQSLAVYDRSSGGMMRMSNNTFRSAAPIYDSTGKYLYFDAVDAQGKRGIFRMLSDGSAAPELVREVPHFAHITSIANGRASVTLVDPDTKTDLWMMSLDGKEFAPFRKTPAAERQGSFSPDGKYLAYASDESGRSEIYVESASGSGARWQISVGGGEQPRWSKKGNEIFYRTGSKMLSVAVQENPFSASKPVELFDTSYDRGGAVAGYDVTPDGQHFLMSRSEEASPTEIRVIMNWTEQLKREAAKEQ